MRLSPGSLARRGGAPFTWQHAIAFYAVCTAGLGWPTLFGKVLFDPHVGSLVAHYARAEFAAGVLRTTGTVPLWNPYEFGGLPFVGAGHGALFYPTFLLRLLSASDVATTWTALIHVFLAGALTYGLLRCCGVRFFAALIGGAAYLAGGRVAGVVLAGSESAVIVPALLPLVLWMTKLFVHDGRRAAWGGLMLAIGLVALTPDPTYTVFLIILSTAFAVHCAFGEWDDAILPRGTATWRFSLAVIAICGGLLIGAVQYLPMLHFSPLAARPLAAGYAHAVRHSVPPEELLNAYLPQFSGLLDRYWGRTGGTLQSDYVGAVVLLLAAAVPLVVRNAQGRALARFWTTALIVSLIWAFGAFSPAFRALYAVAGGAAIVQSPGAVLFVAAFALAALAALGADGVLDQGIGAGYPIAWIVAAAAVAVAGATGFITRLSLLVAANGGRPDVALANGAEVAFGAWRSFAFVLAACAMLLAFEFRWARVSLVGWMLAGLVGADLWSVTRSYWRFSPAASEFLAGNPLVDYLQQQPQPGRVVTYFDESGAGSRGDPFLSSSGLMAHGIRDALGAENSELGRYASLIGSDSANFRALTDPRTWRLLNIRFWLGNDSKPPVQGLTRILGPIYDAVGTPLYLYSVPGENPPAWVATPTSPSDPLGPLHAVLDPRLDVGEMVIVDPPAPEHANSRPTVSAAIPKAFVTRYAPGRIDVRLSSPAPRGSALVVSENYFPGWSANVDGTPATVVRADLALLGVPLAEGARNVALSFENTSFHRGLRITLMTAGFGLLALAIGAVLDWRFLNA